jgi:hypothetical protein
MLCLRPADLMRLGACLKRLSRLRNCSVPTLSSSRGDEDIFEWAHHILIFREPRHLLAALDRVRIADRNLDAGANSLENFKNELKLSAVRLYVDDDPSTDIAKLCERVGLRGNEQAVLRALAVEAAYNRGQDPLAAKLLREALGDRQLLGERLCQRLAAIAVRLKDAATAALFLEGLAAPAFERNSLVGTSEYEESARRLFQFNEIEAFIGREPVPRPYSEGSLLKAFQAHLENLARLKAKGYSHRKIAPESVWAEIRGVLAFVAYARQIDAHTDEYYLEQALPFVADAVLQAAHAHGSRAVALTIHNIDEMIASQPGRLGRDSFRRAFALMAFYNENDYTKALARLPSYDLEAHRSANEYVADMCELAIARARIGDEGGARTLLREMNDNILGISRPAKKDPQYIMWAELLELANAEDPLRREERVRFVAQLTNGMSKTEGHGAAQRLARTYLTESGQCSPALAHAVMHQADTDRLANWPTIFAAALKGILKARSDLAPCVARIFDEMVLPVMDQFADEIYEPVFDVMSPRLRGSELEKSVACEC